MLEDNTQASMQRPNTVLAHYIAEPENVTEPWVYQETQHYAFHDVVSEIYLLTSQFWPKVPMSTRGRFWQHRLVLYRPKHIKTTQALLFVTGGIRFEPHIDPPKNTTDSHQLDFARMAAESHSLVVHLQDIPNQYLMFEDGISRKEDSLVAYTWQRFLDNPEKNSWWPVHLPMAKSIVKAMDAVQAICAQRNDLRIENFLVTGASKRGLATWLAALADERINAIVPIVIDILDTKKVLARILENYQGQWPEALSDYLQQMIHHRIHTPEFTALMQIEDPLTYLQQDCHTFYRKRLSIPKYIISASGDDFFVPDALAIYFDQLPGENRIRVIPNQSHYIDMQIVENALLIYYQELIQNNATLPKLRWEKNNKGIIEFIRTTQQPIAVKLWQASNLVACDFRKSSNIVWQDSELIGNQKKNDFYFPIDMSCPIKGWKAFFVEVLFEQKEQIPFIFTTPVFVMKA